MASIQELMKRKKEKELAQAKKEQEQAKSSTEKVAKSGDPKANKVARKPVTKPKAIEEQTQKYKSVSYGYNGNDYDRYCEIFAQNGLKNRQAVLNIIVEADEKTFSELKKHFGVVAVFGMNFPKVPQFDTRKNIGTIREDIYGKSFQEFKKLCYKHFPNQPYTTILGHLVKLYAEKLENK